MRNGVTLKAAAVATILGTLLVAAPASTRQTTQSIFDTLGSTGSKTVDLRLRARFGPLELARGTMAIELSGSGYNGSYSYRTSGIAASFSDDAGSGTVRGRVQNGQLRPTTFSNRETTGKKRRIDINFASRPVQVSASPMWGDMGTPVTTEAQKRSSVDPITGLMELALVTGRDGGRLCGGTVRIFDGKRHYSIATRYVSEQRVSTPAYSGMASYCRGTFTELAGFKEKPASERSLNLEMWVADVGGVGASIPVRMRGGRNGVNVTLYAESATIR